VRRLGLAIARLATTAWVGAAALFVVTAVREVMHSGFDSATKDQLALLRFPAYYGFGFVLLALALAGTAGAWKAAGKSRLRIRLAGGLLGLALALMAADFVAIYRPMAEMITPPGRTHVAEFRPYHRASVWINVIDVGLCGVAAVLLCWPGGGAEVAAGSPVE
jgi:hypothetical protein